MKIEDLTGKVFNRLTAIKLLRIEKRTYGDFDIWTCKCECGSTPNIPGVNLRTGKTKSCGCFRVDQLQKKLTKHGHAKDGKKSKEYSAWVSMIQRCRNPKSQSYERYGGRGIDICPQWEKFETFLKDMGFAPDKSLSIERDDNNLGYFKGNCRWAKLIEQANNKRSNIILSIDGSSKTLSQWSRISGVKRCTIEHRLENGWGQKEAVMTPADIKFHNKNKPIELDGITHSLKEWGDLTGKNRITILTRLSRGWTVKDALSVSSSRTGKQKVFKD